MKRPIFFLIGIVSTAAACAGKTTVIYSDAGSEPERGHIGAGATATADGGTASTPSSKKDSGTTTTKDSGAPPDINDPICAPDSVTGFSPTWKAPAAFHQAKCTDTQIDAIVSCNFDDTADATTCDKVLKDAANKDCNSCLFTASTATKRGPVIINGNIGSLNIAGCIANFESNPSSATSCGAKYQAANDCGEESCAANCPGDDAAGLKAKNACIQKALTTVCQSFATDADCANALLDTGGAAEPCNEGNSFEEAAVALGKLFCGT